MKAKNYWIVALMASILSFLLVLFSLLLSNYFQENITDLNEKIVEILPKCLISCYLKIALFIKEILSFLKLEHFEKAPQQLVPIFFCVWAFLEELGIKNTGFFNESIKNLYKGLNKAPNNTGVYVFLYYAIRFLTYTSIVLFSIFWYYGDFLSQLLSALSLIIIYILGYIYSNLFKRLFTV